MLTRDGQFACGYVETGHTLRTLAVLSCALMMGLATLSTAKADEGGVPFWPSCQYASLAAVPTTPGWSLPMQAYYYDGDASGSKSFTRGDSVTAGFKSRL